MPTSSRVWMVLASAASFSESLTYVALLSLALPINQLTALSLDPQNAERYFQRSLQLLLKQPTDAQWPQPQNQPRGVPALPLPVQRAHSNVAMVAIARRSATATRAQLVEYRSRSV